MQKFYEIMWKMNRLTEDQLDKAVLMGRITYDQAEEIKKLPR